MRRASAPLSAAALRARRAALSSFRIRRVSTAAHMANQGEYTKGGQFVRPPSAFRNAVSRDPSSPHPAEKGRYALYVSPGCPWAHRTLIVRILKGLESIVDLYQVHPEMGPDGWYFSGEGGSLPADPLHGYHTLKELYLHADPAYRGRYTVPVLWDKTADTLVSNESADIIRMFYAEFDHLLPAPLREAHRPGGGLLPDALRADIDALNAWVYDAVNDGVYKAGFATAQDVHAAHVRRLFAALDRLEARLADAAAARGGRPAFLFGDHLTEADVRLYTTLARFDVAYHPVFLCNLKYVRHDYPHLYRWLRRLYWDRDEDGPTRGAFYKTTAPYLGLYGKGYAHARHRIVFQGQGPLITPVGPAVLIDPLPEA